MILHDLDSEAEVDLVNIPPDNDLSDEDEIDDSQLGEAIVADVPGTLEVHTVDDEEETPSEPPKKRSRQNKTLPVWRAMEPEYSSWGEMPDRAAKSRAGIATSWVATLPFSYLKKCSQRK